MSQQVSALLSKQSYQTLRKLGVLQQISTFPSSTCILNKHPRQSWSKDCSPAEYRRPNGAIPQYSPKFPQESSINLPSRFRKLIPSRFWKLITCRVHTSLPDFIQRLFPHQGIIGLSSANYHGKIVPGEVLPIPSGVHQIPQHNISTGSPAELSSKPQRSISPHRVIPRRVIS